MQKRVTGPEIERLIQLLARVPGLGPRSARRAALHLIKKKDQLMGPLALAMNEAFDKVQHLFDLRQRRHSPIPARSAPIPHAIRA
jgi:recombinational DNA repair protein RecR